MSWTRCEREGKDGVLAAIAELVDAGVPVPSVLAIADLRVLRWLEQEGGPRVPPYRALAERWCWGPKRALLLLQNEARWSDPDGGVEGRKRGATRAQEGRNEGARGAQPMAGEPDQYDSEGARGAQRGRNEGARGAQVGTRARSLLDTSTSTSTSTTTGAAPAPPSLVLVPPQAPAEDSAPSWAAKVPHKGTTSAEYANHVVRALSAIRGREGARCETDARAVVGLWKALGRPPIGTLADELVLVAEWAQKSQEPMAARSLRAEGWAEGVDRSRSVQTLCRRDAWGDRLEAARRWQEHGDRPVSEPQRRTGGPAPPSAGDGVLDRLWAAEQAKRAEEFEA